jgi:hypothetical protein
VNDSGDAPLLLKPLAPTGDFEIEISRQALAKFDYFLDLSPSLELPKALRQVSTGRMELGGKWPFVLEWAFHALVFHHKVMPQNPSRLQRDPRRSHIRGKRFVFEFMNGKPKKLLKSEAGRFRKNFNV